MKSKGRLGRQQLKGKDIHRLTVLRKVRKGTYPHPLGDRKTALDVSDALEVAMYIQMHLLLVNVFLGQSFSETLTMTSLRRIEQSQNHYSRWERHAPSGYRKRVLNEQYNIFDKELKTVGRTLCTLRISYNLSGACGTD